MNQRVATHESAFFFVVLMGFCYLSKRKHRNVVFFYLSKLWSWNQPNFFFFPRSKKKLCALYGKWTECLYVVDPAGFEAHKKNDKRGAEEKKGSKAVWTDEFFQAARQ